MANERYIQISKKFFSGAHVIALVFDLTKQDSFENIKDYWIPKIRECVDESMTIFLIGNKTDLKQEFEVNLKEV